MTSATTHNCKTVSVTAPCDAAKMYRFIANPENLPEWAAGLCQSVSHGESGWIVKTPLGDLPFHFCIENDFGVLDHFVQLPDGQEVYVPMRVISNGAGCEVSLTIFQMPNQTDKKFIEDCGNVEKDLNALKSLSHTGRIGS